MATPIYLHTVLLLLVMRKQVHPLQQPRPRPGPDRYERLMRWHIFHNEPIAVRNMRAECMGSGITVLNITMIVNGGECKENKSRGYLTELKHDIEACSHDDRCEQVTWNPKMLSPQDDCVIYLASRASVCLAYMVQYRQPCLDHFYTELNALTVSALDIQYICDPLPEPLRFSVITTTEWQHINIGHLITECNSQHDNQYLNIVGFVEVSNHCPADKNNYKPPELHPMVKILQDHVEGVDPLVYYNEYQHNLTLRVICGNMLIPVMLDGLVALNSVQGWIYYECGIHGTFDYTWNQYWFNVTSHYKNRSHIIQHTSATSTWLCQHSTLTLMIIGILLILLTGGLVAEALDCFRRDPTVRQRQQASRGRWRCRVPWRRREPWDVRSSQSTETTTTTLSVTSSRQNTQQTTRHNIQSLFTITPTTNNTSREESDGRAFVNYANELSVLNNTPVVPSVTGTNAEQQENQQPTATRVNNLL